MNETPSSATPPTPESNPPPVSIDKAPPISTEKPPPPPAAPPVDDSGPGAPAGRLVAGIFLIILGLVFLAGNIFAVSGSFLFLGLGIAFLIARVVTGRRGFAVPSGILLGFGAFVALNASGLLLDETGAWFFVFLGLGFALVYVIGWQFDRYWPLFPAVALLAFGALLLGVTGVLPVAFVANVAALWPIILILIGAWLVFRHRLPEALQRAIGIGGVALLIIYGLLVMAASTVATVREGPFSRFSFGGFRGAPNETVNLNAPIRPGDTLRVINPNGRTVIRGGNFTEVRVKADQFYSIAGQRPEIRMTPGINDVTVVINTGPRGSFFAGNSNRVDLTIELPANAEIDARATSGEIEISGVTGAVQADTSSGDITLSNLPGAATVRSSSGNVTLNGLAGDARVQTTSGNIDATDLTHPRDISSSSGGIRVTGTFVDNTHVQSSSGSVTLRLRPDSSVKIDVTTNSGAVNAGDLPLEGLKREGNKTTGTLAAGTGNLTIQTSSGSVTLTNAR